MSITAISAARRVPFGRFSERCEDHLPDSASARRTSVFEFANFLEGVDDAPWLADDAVGSFEAEHFGKRGVGIDMNAVFIEKRDSVGGSVHGQSLPANRFFVSLLAKLRQGDA